MNGKALAITAIGLMLMCSVFIAYSDSSDAASVTTYPTIEKTAEVGEDGYYGIGLVSSVRWSKLSATAASSCQYLSGNLPAGTSYQDVSSCVRNSQGYTCIAQFQLNGTYTQIGIYQFYVRGTANGTVQDTLVTVSIYADIGFDSQGGSAVDTVRATSAFALPSAGTKSGYDFAGWYTAASGGTRVGGAGDVYAPGVSTTLYAHWTAANRTVSFNANGGSSTITSQSVTDGTQITLPSASKQYCSFAGWYTAQSGGTRVGGAGDSYTVTGNITLFAQYNVIPVSFATTQADEYCIMGSSFTYNVVTSPADASLSVSGASWLSVSGRSIVGTPTSSVGPACRRTSWRARA